MNIYKTKSDCYINMDQVKYIHTSGGNGWTVVAIAFSNTNTLDLKDDEAKAFLDYLNRLGFYAGYA